MTVPYRLPKQESTQLDISSGVGVLHGMLHCSLLAALQCYGKLALILHPIWNPLSLQLPR